tara:strand:- start:3734 stop:4483 length:750 start_codon:yes stop_codon:yes gene_type:complete
MINLNNKIIQKPFPILIQENFLDTDLYNELLKNFPKEKDFGKPFRMHGELTYPDVNYNKLLEKECWKKLHNYIYSRDFVDKILNYFNNELREQKDLLLNLNDIEFVLEYEGRNIQKKYNTTESNGKVYTRVDIGYGKDEYGKIGGGRGIHIDNRSRLFSMLLYFCDNKDFENGEFQIHDCENNFNINDKIKPKHNLAIISIQNNKAYHSVNPVKNCKSPRYALYISIYSKENIWKMIDDKYLSKMSKNR